MRAVAYARLTQPPAIAPTPAETRPELVDAKTLAQMTQLPVSWIRSAARDGKLPMVRTGRYMRFDADDVLATLKNHSTPPYRRRRRRKAMTAVTTVAGAQDSRFCGTKKPCEVRALMAKVSSGVQDS